MRYDAYPHYWVNHLGFLIRRELTLRFEREGHSVTAEEWAVLLILQARPGMTPSELSDESLRDRTTITRTVDRMVGKGLVERRTDENDRRVQRLHLTAEGAEVFGALSVMARGLIARSVEGIGEPELDVTVRTLARMAANLKKEA